MLKIMKNIAIPFGYRNKLICIYAKGQQVCYYLSGYKMQQFLRKFLTNIQFNNAVTAILIERIW